MSRSTHQPITITVDTENTDATHAAWWVIVDQRRRGWEAIVSGPYFSRAEAEEQRLPDLERKYGRRFEVWALPGAGQYRVRWEEATRAADQEKDGRCGWRRRGCVCPECRAYAETKEST